MSIVACFQPCTLIQTLNLSSPIMLELWLSHQALEMLTGQLHVTLQPESLGLLNNEYFLLDDKE